MADVTPITMTVQDAGGANVSLPVAPPGLTPVAFSGNTFPADVLAAVPAKTIRVYRVNIENVGADCVLTLKTNVTALPRTLFVGAGEKRMIDVPLIPLWQCVAGDKLAIDCSVPGTQIDATFDCLQS